MLNTLVAEARARLALGPWRATRHERAGTGAALRSRDIRGVACVPCAPARASGGGGGGGRSLLPTPTSSTTPPPTSAPTCAPGPAAAPPTPRNAAPRRAGRPPHTPFSCGPVCSQVVDFAAATTMCMRTFGITGLAAAEHGER